MRAEFVGASDPERPAGALGMGWFRFPAKGGGKGKGLTNKDLKAAIKILGGKVTGTKEVLLAEYKRLTASAVSTDPSAGNVVATRDKLSDPVVAATAQLIAEAEAKDKPEAAAGAVDNFDYLTFEAAIQTGVGCHPHTRWHADLYFPTPL